MEFHLFELVIGAAGRSAESPVTGIRLPTSACGGMPVLTTRSGTWSATPSSGQSAVDNLQSAIDSSRLDSLRRAGDVHGHVGAIRIERDLEYAVVLVAEQIVRVLNVIEREAVCDER